MQAAAADGRGVISKLFLDLETPEQRLLRLYEKRDALLLAEKQARAEGTSVTVQAVVSEKTLVNAEVMEAEHVMAHLPQREARVPLGVKPPRLDNIYLLKVKNLRISRRLAQYRRNRAVLYAEPNRLYFTQAFPDTAPDDKISTNCGA